ncbi:hypothetical protein [Oceanobacter mangrovi]|uniref:hypothetical protein n=1 Tax=Oceanobacter mangrovi TaxID=2862510 RepID=UPI001C8EEE10|nr:hypothetical protein [Oceanobacter mangrovi]
MKSPRVLIACERSARVRDAFLARGFDAWSCDLADTYNPTPNRHIKAELLASGLLYDRWDLVIAHPTCTYLTTAAEWCYRDDVAHKVKAGTLTGEARRQARNQALAFVQAIWDSPCPNLVIENPVGVITKRTRLPKPQYVQPWMFGEDASKKTGLWKRGVPDLVATDEIAPRYVEGRPRWGNQTDSGQNKLSPGPQRWMLRSLTPQGLAEAMAAQWGDYLIAQQQEAAA